MNLLALPLYFWIKNEIDYYVHNVPSKFMEYLGKFSYSIYLCHGVVLVLLYMFLELNIFTYPLLVLFGLVLSYIYYLIIEKPSHRLAVKLSNKFS